MLQKTDNMEFDQNSVRNIEDADWWTWPPLAALSRVRGWPTFQFVRFQSRSCSCFSHWRSIVATGHSHERGAHADPGGRAVGSRLHVHQLGAGGRGRHTEGKKSISDGCSSSPSKPCTLFLFPYFSQINRHRCPLHDSMEKGEIKEYACELFHENRRPRFKNIRRQWSSVTFI
jgi:hypothetical protein